MHDDHDGGDEDDGARKLFWYRSLGIADGADLTLEDSEARKRWHHRAVRPMTEVQHEAINAALDANGGVAMAAARDLGVNRRTVQRYIDFRTGKLQPVRIKRPKLRLA